MNLLELFSTPVCKTQPPDSRRQRGPAYRRSAAACLLLFATFFASGCGHAYYEQRLAETARYFEYLHTLDQNLTAEWTASGVSLRVPRQFAPETVDRQFIDDEGNVGYVTEPRQPYFLPVEDVRMPGLVGAWQADVVAGTGGQSATAWLYVMTNRDWYLDDSLVDSAADFHGLVLGEVAHAIGVEAPPQSDPRWATEEFPPRSRKHYASRNALTSITLTPDAPIHDRRYELRLYLHAAGPGQEIQSAFLYVVPTGVSEQERLSQRIELSFETLRVESSIPQNAPGAPGVSGGGPTF